MLINTKYIKSTILTYGSKKKILGKRLDLGRKRKKKKRGNEGVEASSTAGKEI